MSNKTVKWSDSSVSGHKGSSRYDHDSGVGSLSSEQASTGGKPDRRFTAEDLERQRHNPRVLVEALQAKDDDLARSKQEKTVLVAENHKLRSDRKALDKEFKSVADEASNLQARVNALEVSNEQLQAENEKLKSENYQLRRRSGTSVTSEPDYTMSGGLGESSAGIPHRTKSKSKQESPEIEHLRKRITPPKGEPKRSSSKRRGSSSAPKDRTPYIEDMTSGDRYGRSRPPVSASAQYNTPAAHYSYNTAVAPVSYAPEPPSRRLVATTRRKVATT
ncbi:hypothetical protein PG999_001746 [Apiospora kogelbergensis]|uniref:Uncharacterized protein n=1 Tax=Apiospora kogelbergensis TaxID=1337665 RepID=A0AAW0R6D6_9PEZI